MCHFRQKYDQNTTQISSVLKVLDTAINILYHQFDCVCALSVEQLDYAVCEETVCTRWPPFVIYQIDF